MTTVPLTEYTLPPLPNAWSHVRLLYLQAGDESDEIHVKLSIHDHDQVSEYNAISYTWGNTPADSEYTVWIDRAPFRVRKNCHYALWQARLHHPNKFVWIDAICIDQKDDAEKSAQVTIMGEIFARAEVVMCCIGAHADDSEILAKYNTDDLNKLRRMTVLERQAWLQVDDEERFTLRVHEASEALLRRAYWRRIWIVQEVAVAASKVILCGNDCLVWNIIHIGDEKRKTKARRGFQADERAGDYDRNAAYAFLQEMSTATAKPHSISLEGIIIRFTLHECTDPRDRIYGLLALIDWPDGSVRLQPDYSLSAFQLAIKVLERVSVECTDLLISALKLNPDDMAVQEALQQRRNFELPPAVFKFPGKGLQLMNVRLMRVKRRADSRLGSNAPDQTGRTQASTAPANDSRQTIDQNMPKLLRQYICSAPSAVKAGFSSHPPRILFDGQKAQGFLCRHAREGDFVAIISESLGRESRTWHLGLVLRHLSEHGFGILGQCLMSSSNGFGFDTLYEDLRRYTLNTTLSIEDVVILVAQDESAADEGVITRLGTHVNDCRTGFAIADVQEFEEKDVVELGLEMDLINDEDDLIRKYIEATKLEESGGPSSQVEFEIEPVLQDRDARTA